MGSKLIKFPLLVILEILSFIWCWLYRLRRMGYLYGVFKQNTFHVPIISVGNITFGGTGKTPFTMWLSEYFTSIDKKVLILMRGYKGELEHKRGILRSDVNFGSNPNLYGDEALMLSKRLKDVSIVVGKKRSENLTYYYPQEEPDVVILDDGHQHLKLQRNLNIVLFDSLLPEENYKVAPRGYLREGLTALNQADVVIWGRRDLVSDDKIENLKRIVNPHLSSKVIYAEMRYEFSGLYNSRSMFSKSQDALRDKKVICMAGIASPESFYALVESLGGEIIKKASFPDHHIFKADELKTLLKLANEEDAYIITTEKDMVKLRKVINDDRIMYLEISVSFLSGEEQLLERISKCILK